MKYCITVEQLQGQPKSHAITFFNNYIDAYTSFVKRCEELGYEYIDLPQGTALMSAGGIDTEYRVELMHSNFAFLTSEEEEVVS
jgi:hypothetical protein